MIQQDSRFKTFIDAMALPHLMAPLGLPAWDTDDGNCRFNEMVIWQPFTGEPGHILAIASSPFMPTPVLVAADKRALAGLPVALHPLGMFNEAGAFVSILAGWQQ